MESVSPWARRTGLLVLCAGCFAVWSGVDGYAKSHMFMVNRTESLPNWAFFIARGKDAKRGDTVFFVPRRDPLVTAHFGADPAPFGKIVYGVGGDEVSHEGSVVRIRQAGSSDWRDVAVMKPVSLRGEPLVQGPVGIVPQGCFYVGTPHKDGFDSRYGAIGFVCRDRLVGVAEATLL